MQYSQEHLKTMVYAKFGGQTECIMGNWKIENIEKISICLNRGCEELVVMMTFLLFARASTKWLGYDAKHKKSRRDRLQWVDFVTAIDLFGY